MKCRICESGKIRTLDTTKQEKENLTRRRKECENGHRFTTFEMIVPARLATKTVMKMLSNRLDYIENYTEIKAFLAFKKVLFKET